MKSSLRFIIVKAEINKAIVSAIFTLLAPLCIGALQAQTPDTALPIKPSYGVGRTEFLISAEPTKWTPGYRNNPGANSIADLWLYAHDLGANILSIPGSNHYQNLLGSQYRQANDRLIMVAPLSSKLFRGGLGREVQFYPFDSVQSPFYICKFLQNEGRGRDGTNTLVQSDKTKNNTERIFDSLSSTDVLIASQPVFDYDTLTGVHDKNAFLHETYNRDDLGENNDRSFYFVTTGHMFNDSATARDTDYIFRIEVFYTIASGQKYLANNATDTLTATQNLSILVDTFGVRKAELVAGSPLVDLRLYRTISRFSDLRTRRADGGPGPMHAKQPADNQGGSRQINIKVYWTGKEKAALRSVAIRDRLGELVLGSGSASVAYRQDIVDDLNSALCNNNGIAALDTNIIRVYVGAESASRNAMTEYAAFERIAKMIRETYNRRNKYLNNSTYTPKADDSVPATQKAFGVEHFYHATTCEDILVECLSEAARDTVREFRFGDTNHPEWQAHLAFETPENDIPALPQHNGGKPGRNWHLPRLGLTLDSVERYESCIQRFLYGHYHPEHQKHYFFPQHEVPGWASNFGAAARASRRSGRRLIAWIGTANTIQLRIQPVGTDNARIDTLIGHTLERSELLATANLGLCYGARGVHWGYLGNPQYLYKIDTATVNGQHLFRNNVGTNVFCCFGSKGFYSDEITTNDTNLPLRIRSSPSADYEEGVLTPVGVTIHNYWLGWGVRHKAIQWINKQWLRKLGDSCAKRDIRWRDGYSIHYTMHNPNLTIDTFSRPLPNTEVVTEVKAYGFRDTVIHNAAVRYYDRQDSTYRTYVELGFFDKKKNYIRSGYDTTYIMALNRRVLECPSDIEASSPVGRALDSLAETRRITLKLNIPAVASAEYVFVRVRDVAPDFDTLPWSTYPRRKLDTIIDGRDSLVSFLLGPGRATLLEITHVPPDDSLFAGILAYNSQRKLLYDGKRYHATYYRYDSTFNTNTVFYRRSYTVDSTTGSIFWEPVEKRVSVQNTLVGMLVYDTARYDSRHPSLTWRKIKNDTIISIVWTCHPADTIIPGTWDREVCLRDINTSNNILRRITSVDHHAGVDPEQWGTPVICHADGGDFIAWSDSAMGVKARFRVLDTNLAWGIGPVFSAANFVSFGNFFDPFCPNGLCQYPSVPTFASIPGRDSNCAIVWQRTNTCVQPPPPSGRTDIFYARLFHDSTNAAGTPFIHTRNYLKVSEEQVENLHPSIDQVQDDFKRLFEGVVWEAYNATSILNYAPRIYFRSMNTLINTGNPPLPDTVGQSFGWGISSLRSKSFPAGLMYPNASWVRQIHFSPWDTTGYDSIYYSVAFMKRFGTMAQGRITFGGQAFNAPIDYMYSGVQPSGSATHLQLNANDGRHAVLYRSIAHTDSALRTTRQFFARVRPTDYLARGRQAVIRLDTLARAALSVHLFDAWIATDSSAVPLVPQARANIRAFTDSLPQVQGLMRTEYFTGHDSVLIGCEVGGEFTGDTSVGQSAKLTCYAELVDSASGGAVVVLDSFRVSGQDTGYTRSIERVVDLLTGTYYVRLRIVEDSLPAVACASGSVYPVIEMAEMVESNSGGGYGKRMRVVAGKAGSVARISAQPTPFTGQTELRFSLPRADYATVTVYDSYGRVVARPVLKAWVEAGRYAVEVDGSQWEPGVYVAELQTMRTRVVAKVTVLR